MISETHKEIFRDFCALLKKNNIEHFLVAGSLLGAWRDKSPIKGDSDFDIGIHVENYEKVKEIIKQSNTFRIYHMWRREITIVKLGYQKSESQIDIFFIEQDNEYSYLYSSKSNPFSGMWDIEWRMKFPKNIFNNLINYTSFLPNLTIKIPKEVEKVLELEYENWKIKNLKWNTYDAPAYDKNYREIAIVIPTFLRDECLQTLINSIKNILPNDWYRLYIVDQGFYTKEKQTFYNELKLQEHVCEFIPFNSGLSRARNYAINKIKEPFVLIVDDDFEFTKNTKLHNFINILLTKSDIGIVGGNLANHSEYNYNLVFYQNKLYYIKIKPKEYFYSSLSYVQESVPFIYCDIVLNFALFKKEVFEDLRWDNELKLTEHTDFYLQLKKLNKWKVTFTPTVLADHIKHNNSKEYIEFRQKINVTNSLKLVEKKWQISDSNILYVKED